MYETAPPTSLPPPAPGPSLGCFAKGCLTIAVVGVVMLFIFGGVFWYMSRTFRPYLSQQPASIRVFPATNAQYQAVENKINPFAQAVDSGHQATLALSADDLNTLIARDPRYAALRGKAYLSIANNEISAEVNALLNGDAPAPQHIYFHARVVFDASFASGDFTLVPRRMEPLDGGPTPPAVAWIISQPNFSRSFSRGFNESFHEGINKNAAAAAFLGRLHTIIVRDNQIVFTAQEAPGSVAVPPDPH